MKKSYISSKIDILNSKIVGRGMFAKEEIKKSEVVIRWAGTQMSSRELKELDKDDYIIIQIADDLYSVEIKNSPEDDSYFINHSCDSNVWMKDGITFVTRRDIKIGEELTVDYALFESEDYVSKWKCNCGSKCCRKKITGKDYLINEVRERYKGHFPPIIERKLI